MYVYISGPYSTPDPVDNTREAVKAAAKLREAGHDPFVPHLFLLWHFLSPAPYEAWMQLTLSWVKRCDALVRLPGESPGADREVELARELGIPVYARIEDLEPPR